MADKTVVIPEIPADLRNESVSGCQIQIEGTSQGSDILWNNFNGHFRLISPKGAYLFSTGITPFTGNCGVKALQHMNCYRDSREFPDYWRLLTSFLRSKCNVSVIVASDWVRGSTKSYLDMVGFNWSDEYGNPNYGGNGNSHKIVVGHKPIIDTPENNIWNQVLPKSL